MSVSKVVKYTLDKYYSFDSIPNIDKELAVGFEDVRKPYRRVDKSTYVGIEIEVENIVPTNATWESQEWRAASRFWTVTTDGSLRNNGKEFVSKPIRGDNIQLALILLKRFMDTHLAGYEFTERTGIHVHVNARKFSASEVMSFFLVNTALEPLLFKFIGHERDDNIFCIPVSSTKIADTIGSVLAALEGNPNSFRQVQHYFVNACQKYMSTNYVPLFSYGTIEHRHMEGNLNITRIMTWINLILLMKKYVYKTTLPRVIETITELNTNSHYPQFVADVFGPLAYEMLALEPNVALMENAVTFVKDCVYHKTTHRNIVTDTSPLFKAAVASGYIADGRNREKKRNKIIVSREEYLRIQDNIISIANRGEISNEEAVRELALYQIGEDLNWNPPPQQDIDRQFNEIRRPPPEPHVGNLGNQDLQQRINELNARAQDRFVEMQRVQQGAGFFRQGIDRGMRDNVNQVIMDDIADVPEENDHEF